MFRHVFVNSLEGFRHVIRVYPYPFRSRDIPESVLSIAAMYAAAQRVTHDRRQAIIKGHVPRPRREADRQADALQFIGVAVAHCGLMNSALRSMQTGVQ